MTENTLIVELKGVGEKSAKLFGKLGIFTIGDLIRHYPRGFSKYDKPVLIANAPEGEIVTLSGAIFGKVQVQRGRKLSVTTLMLKDLTGSLRVLWFHMPYLSSSLSKGGAITLRGRIRLGKKGRYLEHPEIFFPATKYEELEGKLVPYYPLTTGISNAAIIKALKQALEQIEVLRDYLPLSLRKHYKLAEANFSFRQLHFPDNEENYMLARRRLVFEELFFFILSIRRLKKKRAGNLWDMPNNTAVDNFLKTLPFTLTKAQERTWNEIRADLESPYAMSRLVQGDVGSGKTILAIIAILRTVSNGYQAALMAPTEVLAKQHYETLSKMLDVGTPGTICRPILLTGSMTAKEKREAYSEIESGKANIIVGTHALIQEKVNYQNLALVITDEQHRFGVKQRIALAEKGENAHILVMSATPIPRTLAMILYGDMDISIVDELPANRLPIKNAVVDSSFRKQTLDFIKKQINDGRQCYIICPMVEESEGLDARNVTDYTEELKEDLGENDSSDFVISALHGKMKQKEKDRIMEAFKANEIQILVSTTVIEVGIDVPNATVIIIENAERFGLSQLHQLRGRVGRGEYQSYCIFMSDSKTDQTKERLEVLKNSNDGFFIAKEDLRLRGPGDMTGLRQSGLMEFRLADIFQDAGILQEASEAVSLFGDEIDTNELTFYNGLKKESL
ncbi:MAG: ATP-dependent DNA helicase RecG [Lachnospiraceae bacterium]|nr:ATP-dependent DNA helicase RecG [Lachnospiraceae bacterium]